MKTYTYKNLRRQLDRDLVNSTEKIELLNQIRVRPGKLATIQENQQLEEMEYNERDFLHDQGVIALMLEAKAAKKNTYNPFLLDSGDYIKQVEFEHEIKELIHQKKKFHYDFIIKKGPHCTPMQLDFDGEQVRLFLIDAAGDERNIPYANSLLSSAKHNEFRTVIGGIQHDPVSCSIFSIQHLNNLFNLFQAGDINNWTTRDARLLKNIQSTSSFKSYYDKTVDKKEKVTLAEHIDNYSSDSR